MKCWGIFNYRFLGTITLQKQQSYKERKKNQPDFMFKHSRQGCVTLLIICVKTFIPHPVPPRKILCVGEEFFSFSANSLFRCLAFTHFRCGYLYCLIHHVTNEQRLIIRCSFMKHAGKWTRERKKCRVKREPEARIS